jgi:branched-subunit amino acid transport protein
MSQAVIWGAMLAMGVLTLSLRASFLVLPEKVRLPALLRRALRFVPAAVLTAIYAPELMVQSGAINLTLDNARLLAGLVAIAVAWRLRLTFLTIVVGMVALHAFSAIIAR